MRSGSSVSDRGRELARALAEPTLKRTAPGPRDALDRERRPVRRPRTGAPSTPYKLAHRAALRMIR